jgi:signal transduction histidine kinase
LWQERHNAARPEPLWHCICKVNLTQLVFHGLLAANVVADSAFIPGRHMSSEASPTGHGSEAFVFDGMGSSPSTASAWRAVERRVLLSKLEDLEQRARRLDYLESRLRDLTHEVQLLNRLGEASRGIHAATDARGLLDAALEHSLELLRADNGSILLHGPEAGELVVAKACGAPPVPAVGTRVSVGQGVAGYVALRGEPLHVADIAKDGRFPIRGSRRYATGSFVCVPIQNNGTLEGVLSVADRRDRSAFSADDLRTAVAIAKELAAAMARVRRLEASQKLHHHFVSKLAHELRNPLDGVLRFINLILADHHPEERRRRYLRASKQGLERLTGIVNGLSGLGRCARDSDEPVQANDLITQAVTLQEGKAEQRHIQVDLDLTDGLPPVAGGYSLFQVFTNLVSNAYDAMAGGGTLSIGSRQRDGSLVIKFADTGCGMPPEVMECIFTPFFTTKRAGKGMGLGLAVCREVLGRLGGRIEVESEPGKGTTFTVTVPCVSTQGAERL